MVELLVVIAMVCCLIAILSVALTAARNHAIAALCSSNQRQLLMAMAAYDQACGTLPNGVDILRKSPPQGGYIGNLIRDPAGWWWFHILGLPTTKAGRSILSCPATAVRSDAAERLLYGQLGVNWSVCRSRGALGRFGPGFTGDPCSIARILRPTQTLLVVDSGYALIGWPHVADQPPMDLEAQFGYETSYLPGLPANASRRLLTFQRQDAYRYRHPGRAVNAGWMDGHVDWQQAERLKVTRSDAGYSNLAPVWVPARAR